MTDLPEGVTRLTLDELAVDLAPSSIHDARNIDYFIDDSYADYVSFHWNRKTRKWTCLLAGPDWENEGEGPTPVKALQQALLVVRK